MKDLLVLDSVKRTAIGEYIYLFYFALMIGARAAGMYEGQRVYSIALVAGMLLFAFKMVITEYSIKEYLCAAVILFLSGVVYINTGEKGLIVCFTMMLGMKAVSVRKVIKVGSIVAGVIIMSKVFLGVFGFVPEIYYPQERSGFGIMFRHALGYAHPNTLHMNVLMLSMLIMYLVTTHALSKEKPQKTKLYIGAASIFTFLFNFYIFQYSGSRTGLLACIVYLTVNLWLYFRKHIGFFEKVLLYMAFPLVSFVSIVLPLVLDGDLLEFVDDVIFSRRFFLARYFWQNNSISLFGNRLNNPISQFATYGIDMAYLYLLLELGITAFIFISCLTIWFIYEAIKRDRKAELSVLVAMLFLGMWEPLLYNLGFKNFTFVFFGAMLYGVINNDLSYFDCEEKKQFSSDYSVKRSALIIAAAILVGFFASGIYVSLTNPPSVLYGDRAENESGRSLEMEQVYLSEDEVSLYKKAGDIVIGYVDEKTPMYVFDEALAKMEYKKKIISVGVWSGILVILFGMGNSFYYAKFNNVKCRTKKKY